MKRVLLFKAMLTTLSILVYSCCPNKFNMKDIEFTDKELQLLGNYIIGDTISFESNLGDIDTITIVEIYEERHEGGNSCFFPTVGPYQIKQILVKHLPNDKYAVNSQNLEEKMRIIYQPIISTSKSPLNSIKKAGYTIDFKNFTSFDNTLGDSSKEFFINEKIIKNCNRLTHSYPERVINQNDIEIVYWTAKYGLTAYSSKSGETWLIKNYK
jgi:hypothetical protein